MKKKSYLIIYDIKEDKKRTKVAKILQGYGFRIQKSAFEAELNKIQYEKLVRELTVYEKERDSIGIYEINKRNRPVQLGNFVNCCCEDIIVV